jgi:hypothetical protein
MSLPRILLALGLMFGLLAFKKSLSSNKDAVKAWTIDRNTQSGKISALEKINQVVNKDTLAVPLDEPVVLAPDLIAELKSYNSTKKLAKDRNVQFLLKIENRDPDVALSRATKTERSMLMAGAKAVISVLARCLSDGTQCGNQAQWQDYYNEGGEPLMQILERSLQVFHSADSQGEGVRLSSNDLMSSSKIPHHNISVLAASLLQRQVSSRADYDEFLALQNNFKGPAKKFYLLMLKDAANNLKSSDARGDYVMSVFLALSDKDDDWTREEVISGLNRYGLDQEEFRHAVKLTCDAHANRVGEDSSVRLTESLQGMSDRLGYFISVKKICNNKNL